MFDRIYQWGRTLQGRRGARYATLNRIELSQAAVMHNVTLMQRQHPTLNIIPVLKSNAYGHGLVPMARILQDTPYDLLAVDGYFEAAKVRRATTKHVLVMGYILPENVRLLDTERCSFVIQDQRGLEAFGHLKKQVKVHVELNTGMNRLGLRPEELAGYLDVLMSYPNLQVEGIMTHLADADNPEDDSFTVAQVALFDKLVEQILARGFQPRYVHIAQTAGSAKVHSKYANALRLGIGLYGINPLRKADARYGALADLRPVLEFKSRIIKVIELHEGDRVGYNGTFAAERYTRIGILPVGYYEGVPHALGNKGLVTSGNLALPIVGSICMNHLMVDLQATALDVGDELTVFSADPAQPNAVVTLSEQNGLSPYVVLTGLAETVRRQIV